MSKHQIGNEMGNRPPNGKSNRQRNGKSTKWEINAVENRVLRLTGTGGIL
jgi:hypothetical protein